MNMQTIPFEKDLYYIHDGEQYVSQFPREWAENHNMDSGPKKCMNCKIMGSLHGVFLGYCVQCADSVYGYERGLGMVEEGVEMDAQIIAASDKEQQSVLEKKSIFQNYLKDVLMDTIRDALFEKEKSEFIEEMGIGPYDHAYLDDIHVLSWPEELTCSDTL